MHNHLLKIIFLTLYLQFFCLSTGMAQMGPFPDGVYLNFNQLQTQKPGLAVKLKRISRSSVDIFDSGGNDIKFESDIDSLDEKYIKKKVYAYVENNTLYLNGIFQKSDAWYIQCKISGIFNVFDVADVNPYFGLVGALLTADDRAYKVLSLRTGNVRDLNKKYISERLKEHPTLLEKYEQEDEPGKIITMLFYIIELNKVTAVKE